MPVVALVGVLGLVKSDGSRRLEVVGGRSTVTFFPSILDGDHLKVTINSTASGDPNTAEPSKGFFIVEPNLKFTLINGHLSKFDGGSFSHKGGFTLTSGNKTLNLDHFRITASKTLADGLQVSATDGKDTFVAFDLIYPRTTFQVATNQLSIAYMDMIVSLDCAQRLGRTELAGKLIGSMSIFADATPTDGGGKVEIQQTQQQGPNSRIAALDVAISNMGGLVALGRTGTFPNGLNGLSMSTTSCNVGSTNIPWAAPMQVDHPAIAMNMYRLLNGRFEQVGWSWMKHGFFATNSNGCGTCQNPGTGALLGPGCSDTYATSNNGDRFYMGERKEFNPFTGVWTCTNSYFSNYQPDCVRRNNGSGLDAVAHRLTVADSDMGQSGAHYYYEGYYVSGNDNDRYNNIASREASMSWNGSSWVINTIDAQETQGPAINRWGDMRSTAQPQTEGDVIVAVQTTNLGGGMWHYEYAVYNHTLDRQVNSFSIPVPDGTIVQNIDFRDIDTDTTNQWVGTFSNNAITWATGAFGSSTANPLAFATMYNFRFDCNLPPANGSAGLGLFKPGSNPSLSAATVTPVFLQPVETMQVSGGVVKGGTQQSLDHSDDDRLTIGAGVFIGSAGMGVIVTETAPTTSPASLIIGVESSDVAVPTVGEVQTIKLWNWSLSNWELVDTRPTTQSDSVAIVTISANAARFVDPATRQVKAQIMHSKPPTAFSAQPRLSFDQVGFEFN